MHGLQPTNIFVLVALQESLACLQKKEILILEEIYQGKAGICVKQ